jgi:hypothetical protein
LFKRNQKRAEGQKMKMLNKTLAVLAGTGMLLALSPAAIAGIETYDFTFTSGGMDATGTITVENGIAQSGSINVTGVPVEADPSTLLTASGSLLPGSGSAQNHNGDNLPYDNIVNFANNPILTGNGIDFASGQYSGTHYDTLIGLWGGDVNGNPSPGLYTLFVGEALLDGNGNVLVSEYVYNSDSGSLTLAAAPEPAAYGALAGVGLLLVSLGGRLRLKKA